MSIIGAFDRMGDRRRARQQRFDATPLGRLLERVRGDLDIAHRWPLVPALVVWLVSWIVLIPFHYSWVTDQTGIHPQRAGVAAAGTFVGIIGVVVLIVVAMRRAAAVRQWGYADAPVGWRRRVLGYMVLGWAACIGMMMPILAWPISWVAGILAIDATRVLVWRRAVRRRVLEQIAARVKEKMAQQVMAADGSFAVSVPGVADLFGRRAVIIRWIAGTALVDVAHIALPRRLAISQQSVRDAIEEAITFALDGVDHGDPETALGRPERVFIWDHARAIITATRAASLPTAHHPVHATPALIRSEHGVVLGQCSPEDADDVIDGVPVKVWKPHAHALITGMTGAGKSNVVSALGASALAGGHFPGGMIHIDGKASGSAAPFIGRQGLIARYSSADDSAWGLWEDGLAHVERIVEERYSRLRAVREGIEPGPIPTPPRIIVVIDEFQEIITKENRERIKSLSKLAREAGVHLVGITQRSSAEALPKDISSQFEDCRISLGRMDQQTAKMAHVRDEDQDAARSTLATPGRMHVVVGGRPGVRVQAFRMPDVQIARTDRSGLFPPVVDEPPAAPPADDAEDQEETDAGPERDEPAAADDGQEDNTILGNATSTDDETPPVRRIIG